MSNSDFNEPIIGDLVGAGKIINSEVAKSTYDDALSPMMRQIGGLSEDALKTFRLFTAPIQLLAAYQDRFSDFCERVRQRVPAEQQREAPAEIARPVMEAFASTSDGSPLMSMFEELMAKAIDKRESDKLSPSFPDIIRSLSPLEAKLIAALKDTEQITDDLFKIGEFTIMQWINSNFDFEEFGGQAHHLTISQVLKEKNIVSMMENIKIDIAKEYPALAVSEGFDVRRTVIKLTMFGRWFASACVRQGNAQKSQQPKPLSV